MSMSAYNGLAALDSKVQAAHGLIPRVSHFSKFGYNTDIDIGTECVWTYGGLWTPQTTARTLSVVSSSADDDGNPVGTGARTVTIYGVNASRAAQTETITMDGITPVITSGSWLGVNRMVVATAGSTLSNVGNITATSTTDGYVQGHISATHGITNQMIYHVPTGYSAYATRVVVVADKISGGGSPVVTIEGFITYSTGVRIEAVYEVLDTSVRPESDATLTNPLLLPAGSYFHLNATTNVNDTFCRARLEMTLIQA